jgi:hypothetical protein
VKCVVNLGGNLSNLTVVDREEERLFFERKRDIVKTALKANVREFVHVPVLKDFQDQFLELRSRYKFLVVTGASQTGKTVWAFNIAGNLDEVFYVNCAQCPEPDLRGLRRHHKVILLDEASPEMILNQKLLIQGPPDWVKLGCSTTNCHAYEVFVSGVQFVICSNKWVSQADHLKEVEDREWLVDNSFVIDVGRTRMYL